MKKSRKNLDNIREGNTLCTGGCNQLKDNKEFSFYLDRKTADGHRLMVNTNCVDCQSKKRKELSAIKSKFKGITNPGIGKPCECCGNPVTRNWQLDHCHDTGEFRGWLCKTCNTGMGLLGDDIDSIQKALEYLQRAKARINNSQLVLTK